MKKYISLFLALVISLAFSSCNYFSPDFDDFNEYQADFIAVRDFINEYRHNISNGYVLLNGDILSLSNGENEESQAVLKSVTRLFERGFSFVNIKENYMVFWEDETRYYGVLWSSSPKSAINSMKESYYGLKSKRLADQWYEVGALNSI